MEPGNIIHIKKSNQDNYWYVESNCLGATEQEDVVHISRADGKSQPSCLGEKRAMFVPLVMIETLIEAGIAKVYDKFSEHEQGLTA